MSEQVDRIKAGIEQAVQIGDRVQAETLVGLLEELQATKTQASYGGAAATMLTGAIAEPFAGGAGLAQTMNPFAEEGAGAQAVQDVRQAMTFMPEDESSIRGLENVADFVKPAGDALADAEGWLGNATLDLTGSPALASIAHTIPTAMMEVLGLATLRSSTKGIRSAERSLDQIAGKRELLDTLTEAAPSVDRLKEVSSAVYKEIDDIGARIKEAPFESMAKNLERHLKKEGIDPALHPDSTAAMKRITDKAGEQVSLTETDTLRKIASGAYASPKPADARLGKEIMDSIDDFLDNIGDGDFNAPVDVDVGSRYKVARDLWGRARKSELLETAFEDARNQASGFENGIRVQFRALLKNKRTRKLFKGDELSAMQRVVRGSTTENLAKLVGRMGFKEGSATNILGAASGAGAGYVMGGPLGAVALPLIGQVSRGLAQRMTVKNANFASDIIRAGKDGKKITSAYIKNTPKAERSASELAELLMKSDTTMNMTQKLGQEAKRLLD